MRTTVTSLLLLLTVVGAGADAPDLQTQDVRAADTDLQTVPEQSGFTRTSLHADVIAFVTETARRSQSIRVGLLGTSSEGRAIPLVIVSAQGLATPQEARLYDLPVVLLVANIHAGEVEGKEALQMLLRDVVQGELDQLLTTQVLLLVPIFNADGNDRLDAANRRDNGPELAGIRHNGQHLDLNRDFLKLATPEVRALVTAIQAWQPVLFVDMHTTNGSYHQEPVTYTTLGGANASERLKQYMWQQFFPAVAATLREHGYDSLPYGNFSDRTDPTKGWRSHAFATRYSTNYVGLRNIFTVLNENYSHAGFETRVRACHAFVRSILAYTHRHIGDMAAMVRSEDRLAREEFVRQPWVTEYTVERLFDLTVKSYELELKPIPEDQLDRYPPWFDGVLVRRTDRLRDYTVPYFARPIPTATISLPAAYLIPPAHRNVIDNLTAHGIVVEQLQNSLDITVQEYQIDKIETAPLPSQGAVPLTVEGRYQPREATLPAGSFLVRMHQPLARLIPVLLEPSSEDSLLCWGFFDAFLVQQWTNRLNPYPVFRLTELPSGIELQVF